MKTCGDCKHYVGPEEDPISCVTEPYSDKLLLPPFSSDLDSISWYQTGILDSVGNQGKCGSSYAFSTISSIESLLAIKSGLVESFSEQHIIDCDQRNFGCNGGFQTFATAFVAQ